MSDDLEAARERAAIQYMMRRLNGFARGLGFNEAATRQPVEKAAADMSELSELSDEERMDTARRCLLAVASA